MSYRINTDPITSEPNGVVRESDSAFIPCDPANADYAAYLEWVSQGNTPEPWQPDSES